MLGTEFRKATFSDKFANCVEARISGGIVQARDSKDPAPVVAFTPAAWQAFLDGVKC